MKAALITGACINTGVAIVEKFASEGINVVFTGRSLDSVRDAEARYRAAFPGVKIFGYTINAVKESGDVDSDGVEKLFSWLDENDIFIDTLILNAADQGLGMKIFENPISDFLRV